MTALSALDSMWAEVDRIKADVFGEALTERPPGAITAQEYMERYNVVASTANRQLAQMVKAGRMGKALALIPDAKARVYPIAVYFPK